MDCVAETVYIEAKGEGELGMRAVAHVIYNRAKKAGLDPCIIVRKPGQFAKGVVNKYNEQWRIAKRISINPEKDMTGGATHFHNKSVNPRWKLRVTYRFGNHIFYK